MPATDSKMVTVVYTLGTGSFYHDNELRFSLRSVEKHLSNVKNVVIIGRKPEWFKGDYIPFIEMDQIPDNNIFKKLLFACNSDKVSDNFLFMNDDHFLLDYFDASQFPNYYCGSLEGYVKRSRVHGNYFQRVRGVALKFPEGKFFDVHTPIMYNKEKFLQLKEVYDYQIGMVIKSLYGNTYALDGKEITDCKVTDAPIRKVPFISTFPRVSAALFRYIQEQFPLASKYEG